ncbi:MAG: alginate lyase, partial [Pseudomonadota bacterium]
MRSLAIAVLIAFLAMGACSTPPPAFAEVASFEGEPLRKIRVSTQDEYEAAEKIAQPGDVIVLANGTWTDFDLVLEAKGTAA